jgi:hypothetical protein
VACGDGPDLWLNLQKRYDLQRAERELGEKIKGHSNTASGVTVAPHPKFGCAIMAARRCGFLFRGFRALLIG